MNPAITVGAVLFKHALANQIAEFLARTARQDHVARLPEGVSRQSVRVTAVAIIDVAEHERWPASAPGRSPIPRSARIMKHDEGNTVVPACPDLRSGGR